MSNFDNQRQKAFEFCADAVKQLITLATGIVTITITFAKDFVTNVNEPAKAWAYVAWFIYLVSIIAGMLALLSLTAELEPKDKTKTTDPTIRGAAATYSGLQIIAFGVAILLTIIFAIQAVKKPAPKKINNTEQAKKIDTIAVKLDTLNVRLSKECKKK